jgi:peptide-methionine (S)-S-oxide reductase
MPLDQEVATLGGGCFWCLEAVFDDLLGVEQVESGYTGGQIEKPVYDEVCTGTTGHAEVVRIVFDPALVSYRDILEVFFAIHDPTTLNRQGNDQGTQYRSAIFYHSAEQKTIAEDMIAELNASRVWNAPIVTEVSPAAPFYRAEDYHQTYYRNHPQQPYCRAVVGPKMTKFRQKFAAKRKNPAQD